MYVMYVYMYVNIIMAIQFDSIAEYINDGTIEPTSELMGQLAISYAMAGYVEKGIEVLETSIDNKLLINYNTFDDFCKASMISDSNTTNRELVGDSKGNILNLMNKSHMSINEMESIVSSHKFLGTYMYVYICICVFMCTYGIVYMYKCVSNTILCMYE